MLRYMLIVVLSTVGTASTVGQGLTVGPAKPTWGIHGPPRDTTTLVAGDTLNLGFDISGLIPDTSGRLRFATQLRVEAADGKVLFMDTQESEPIGTAFGAGSLRHAVQIATALEQAPGNYVVKATILDRNAKGAAPAEAKLEQRFTVKKPEFALVRCQLTADPQGKVPVGNVGVRGGVLYLHAVAVGYGFDKNQLGAFQVEWSIPEGGKAVVADFGEIARVTPYLPLRIDLPLTRTGNFTLQLKATDLITKATTTMTYPLRVVD